MATPPDLRHMDRATLTFLTESGALTLGLAACFMVLLATKLGGFGAITGIAAAVTVGGLWIGAGTFRRDGLAFGLRTLLCLLPILAIQITEFGMTHSGPALVVESLCVGMLFATSLSRLSGNSATPSAPGRG